MNEIEPTIDEIIAAAAEEVALVYETERNALAWSKDSFTYRRDVAWQEVANDWEGKLEEPIQELWTGLKRAYAVRRAHEPPVIAAYHVGVRIVFRDVPDDTMPLLQDILLARCSTNSAGNMNNALIASAVARQMAQELGYQPEMASQLTPTFVMKKALLGNLSLSPQTT